MKPNCMELFVWIFQIQEKTRKVTQENDANVKLGG